MISVKAVAFTSTHAGDHRTGSGNAERESERLIELESDILEKAFDHQPFLVRHRLSGHPLFDLRSMMKLARRLPAESIEYNAGDIPVSVDPGRTPGNGLSAEETIRRIRECRSWLVLKNVEKIATYGDLLEACLSDVAAAAGGKLPGMRNKQAFIFISSPGAVTPYHIDPEHNFLLQVEGSKIISIFDPMDRAVLSEEDLERFFSGAHRNLEFNEERRNRAQIFRLEPGAGLHFPVTAPHWVKNGNGVSISFSITFRSPISERRETIYKINAILRKIRLKPAAPGKSRWRDAAKLGSFEVLRRGKRVVWNFGSTR